MQEPYRPEVGSQGGVGELYLCLLQSIIFNNRKHLKVYVALTFGDGMSVACSIHITQYLKHVGMLSVLHASRGQLINQFANIIDLYWLITDISVLWYMFTDIH